MNMSNVDLSTLSNEIIDVTRIKQQPPPNVAYQLVMNDLKQPTVFESMIESWSSRHQWTPEYFARELGDLQLSVKIGPKPGSLAKSSKTLFETDCCHEECTLRDYYNWLRGDKNCGRLKRYKQNLCWCYIDYKYMSESFQSHQSIMDAVNWECFGFLDRKGNKSTFWMGSQGANTPCHYDSYGCNLVAQLYGKKKWLMVAPEQSDCMYSTRIPYEESSIFSQVNFNAWDLTSHPKFSNATIYEAVLQPGDVLFVPKHWWHYVECLETAISVNTWIDMPSDDRDRLSEAIARTVVFALKSADDENISSWLNPSEASATYSENMNYVMGSLCRLIPSLQEDTDHCQAKLSDAIVNSILSPDVVSMITKKFISTFAARNR